MYASKSHATILHNALAEWHASGLLDARTKEALADDIRIVGFDWKKLAKYCFWVALACLVIAIGAIGADKELMALIEVFFSAPPQAKAVGMAALAALFYHQGLARRQKHPRRIYSNEGILFLGVLATAASVYFLGVTFDTGSGHFSLLLLLSFFIYGALGVAFRSKLIWVFALLSFGGWMGTETGYMSGWGGYYLGMNYPLRFVGFGGVLVALSFLMTRQARLAYFARPSLCVGLLYLFISLWIMSIFGNYGDMNSWNRVKQPELALWSVLFAAVAGAAVWHGLRFDDRMTKGFGLTFLLINLYTRFFEYFWDGLHKAVFFAVLALSLWALGSRAEHLWHLGENKDKP